MLRTLLNNDLSSTYELRRECQFWKHNSPNDRSDQPCTACLFLGDKTARPLQPRNHRVFLKRSPTENVWSYKKQVIFLCSSEYVTQLSIGKCSARIISKAVLRNRQRSWITTSNWTTLKTKKAMWKWFNIQQGGSNDFIALQSRGSHKPDSITEMLQLLGVRIYSFDSSNFQQHISEK